jgi:hypothetical protein
LGSDDVSFDRSGVVWLTIALHLMSVAFIWHNHWNKGRRRRHMVNINTLILIFVVMMVTFSTMTFSAEPNAQAEENGNKSCQEPIVDAEAVVRSA